MIKDIDPWDLLVASFVPASRVYSTRNAQRTINWFLTGKKDQLFACEIGRYENFRLIKTEGDPDMGMFDTVCVDCPKCGATIEFQSKAGPCELKRYHVSSVPFVIAADISGEIEFCPECNTEITLNNPEPNMRVNMVTVWKGAVEWD